MDRRFKNRSVHDRLRKRVVDQDWADHEEEGNERKYVWRTKQIADRKQSSANIQMTFLLPSEFRVNGKSQQPNQAVGFENLH